MAFFTIGMTLFVGLLVILVIASLIARSRKTDDSDHQFQDAIHHIAYLGHPGSAEIKSNDGGDWGGRDMSHDHHDHGTAGDGGDWGGGDPGGGGDSDGGGGE